LSNIANGNGFGTDTVTGSPNNSDSNLVTTRTYFRDTGTNTAQTFKNAFVSVNHLAGTGTNTDNQDRALAVELSTSSGSYSLYGIEGVQVQLDIAGTPTFQAVVDGEASAASFQVSDTHQGSISAPNLGLNCIRAQYFRNPTSGTWGSIRPNVINAIFTNSSTNAGNGGTTYICNTSAEDVSVGHPVASHPVAWYHATAPTNRFSTNYAVLLDDFGSNANDRNIQSRGSMPSNGRNEFQGPVTLGTFTPSSASDTGIAGTVTWDSSFIYVCTATNTWKRAAIATW
jgi:hypothetical protein